MSIAANAAKLTVNVSILTATGEIITVEVGVSSPVQTQHLPGMYIELAIC